MLSSQPRAQAERCTLTVVVVVVRGLSCVVIGRERRTESRSCPARRRALTEDGKYEMELSMEPPSTSEVHEPHVETDTESWKCQIRPSVYLWVLRMHRSGSVYRGASLNLNR